MQRCSVLPRKKKANRASTSTPSRRRSVDRPKAARCSTSRSPPAAFYLQSEWDNGGRSLPDEAADAHRGCLQLVGCERGLAGHFRRQRRPIPMAALQPSGRSVTVATARGASPSHTYASAGEYTVTMTPTDALTGLDGRPVSHTVTVAPVRRSPRGARDGSPRRPRPPLRRSGDHARHRRASRHAPDSAFSARAGDQRRRPARSPSRSPSPTPAPSAGWPPSRTASSARSRPVGKCKAGLIKLRGKCRPAKIVFAKGQQGCRRARAS